MGNIFNDDFRDFIHQLNNNEVRYILVGGYSVILHGYTRTTGDMDIWIDRTLENYNKIKRAAPLLVLSPTSVSQHNVLIYQNHLFRFHKI